MPNENGTSALALKPSFLNSTIILSGRQNSSAVLATADVFIQDTTV